jgi:hypothetical protein
VQEEVDAAEGRSQKGGAEGSRRAGEGSSRGMARRASHDSKVGSSGPQLQGSALSLCFTCVGHTFSIFYLC